MRKNRPGIPGKSNKAFDIIIDAVRYETIEYRNGDILHGLVVLLKDGQGCERCGCPNGFVHRQGIHYRLDCSECYTLIKMHPKTDLLRKFLEPPHTSDDT
jgi:hypothetical protein